MVNINTIENRFRNFWPLGDFPLVCVAVDAGHWAIHNKNSHPVVVYRRNCWENHRRRTFGKFLREKIQLKNWKFNLGVSKWMVLTFHLENHHHPPHKDFVLVPKLSQCRTDRIGAVFLHRSALHRHFQSLEDQQRSVKRNLFLSLSSHL